MTVIPVDANTGFCLQKQSALYDLSNSEEKKESTRRLEIFYENLQIVLNPDICIEVGAGSGENAVSLHKKTNRSY